MASEFNADSIGVLGVKSPLKCSCQDLLKTCSSNITLSGWLRKKSLRNKLNLNVFNWPQVFLIVCDKCLYYFDNEMSKKPSGSVSLYGFNRIIRSPQQRPNDPPWAFKLEHVQPEFKTMYFSAVSEKEMFKWMRAIKKEMLVANDKPLPPSTPYDPSSSDGMSVQSWTSEDYNDIETSIYACSSADDIDKLRRESRISTISGAEEDNQDGYDLQKPHNDEHSQSKEDSFWSAVHFSGDRATAQKIISTIAENGVFLVRKSEDGAQVLVAFAGTCKKFKIFVKDDGSLYLQSSGPLFGSLEELLYHYCSRCLPNSSLSLKTPYQLHPKYKKL